VKINNILGENYEENDLELGSEDFEKNIINLKK